MRSEKFSRRWRPQGYLPRRQAPRTLRKSTLVGRRGLPWAAVTSASCWDSLSWIYPAYAPCRPLPFQSSHLCTSARPGAAGSFHLEGEGTEKGDALSGVSRRCQQSQA